MWNLNSINGREDLSPTHAYLAHLHAKFALIQEGNVATYIPELAKANPNHFGIALVTATGAVYEVGDSQVPFTIQSISKPFVYGMALEDHGPNRILNKVGVEPTGDAFNSISLDPGTGRPRNPMINAGAIASTGLIQGSNNEARLQRLLESFSRYAGRRLTMDETVYHSESNTGHRNRAIGYMLRNFDILESDPSPATELYFMQCSIAVTCRDLATMAATLANRGLNPVTGARAIREEHVSRVLSVMSSCGMYDYAGEWLYKIGMPAKSGVAGGVIAVLPGHLGIAVYSPRLDAQGNTVRGIRVCEAISRDLELHLFGTPPPGKSAIRRKFTGADLRSTRTRAAEAIRALQEARSQLKIYHLQGSLDYPAAEVVARDVMDALPDTGSLLLDFKRVIMVKNGACRVLESLCDLLYRRGIPVAMVNSSVLDEMRRLEVSLARQPDRKLRIFDDYDRALEWAEDQLIERHAPRFASSEESVPRSQYELFLGLGPDELAAIERCLTRQSFPRGTMIIRAGSEARELFFLASGSATVMVPLTSGSSKRVATFCPGMAFGEMALLDGARRSASVVADADSVCDVLSLDEFDRLSDTHPHLKITVLKNLALGISARLREANRQLSLFA